MAHSNVARAGAIAGLTLALLACQALLEFNSGDVSADASTDALVSDALIGDAGLASDALVGDAGLDPPVASSCREIKARRPTAKTGMYLLVGQDGGFYCDMDNFDGGWTLVRRDMLLSDGQTQDVPAPSPHVVDVQRRDDVRGGVGWEVTVTESNCIAADVPRALHWFVVGELDQWRQIMATYRFSQQVSCWHIFGNSALDAKWLPFDMNVRRFEAKVDFVEPQQNMARTAAGASIPYVDMTSYCGGGPENFWGPDYVADVRMARVVLRRFLQSKPAGLVVATSCGLPVWTVSDVFVR